jgi:hypothetical protein
MYDEYPDEFYDLVDQYVASGRYGGRPEAADAVRRDRPDLCPKTRSSNSMTTISSSTGSFGGSAERELISGRENWRRGNGSRTRRRMCGFSGANRTCTSRTSRSVKRSSARVRTVAEFARIIWAAAKTNEEQL